MDIFVMIIKILFYCINIFFVIGFFIWRKKYYDKDADYTVREILFNGEKAELEEKIKTLEDHDKVIKIEQVIAEPKTLKGRFEVHTELAVNGQLLKSILIKELSIEISKELMLNPYAYQIFTYDNPANCSKTIEFTMRYLPYTEPADWKEGM